MKKNILRTVALIAVIALTFSLTACKKEPGFRFGFNYVLGEERGSLLAVAARSDKLEFDIDDITIEFSYGWYNHSFTGRPQPEKYVFYFFLTGDYNDIIAQTRSYDLSNNIDKAVFVKEIFPDEFLSEKYEFKTSRKRGKEFNHSETLTIPKEVLSGYVPNGRGEIVFMMAKIVKTEDDIFVATKLPNIKLPYQFIDEKTIKIRV